VALLKWLIVISQTGAAWAHIRAACTTSLETEGTVVLLGSINELVQKSGITSEMLHFLVYILYFPHPSLLFSLLIKNTILVFHFQNALNYSWSVINPISPFFYDTTKQVSGVAGITGAYQVPPRLSLFWIELLSILMYRAWSEWVFFSLGGHRQRSCVSVPLTSREISELCSKVVASSHVAVSKCERSALGVVSLHPSHSFP
jgi:hypothetical protein